MISTSHTDGVLLLTVTEDRIDLASADRLKTDLLRAFEQSKQDFAVDMANVRFVDSTGLGALVSVYKTVTNTHRMELKNTTPFVSKVLNMTKLSSVFSN